MLHSITNAAAGGRRFWVTVAIFAVLNASAWIAYHHLNQSPAGDLLRVERFVCESSQADARPLLLWTFNLDVASHDPQHAPGEIKPAVEGHWRWINARTLSFAPAEVLPKATPFDVTLRPAHLRTPQGFRMAEPRTDRFRTAPLQVIGVRQVGILDGDRYVLELEFSDRVLPADLLAHLSVRKRTGEPVSVALHGQALDQSIRVATAPLPNAVLGQGDSQVLVEVRAGLSGVSGPLGLESGFNHKVQLEKQLAFVGIEAHSPATGQTALHLRANGTIDTVRARQVVSVEPPVPFILSDGYSGVQLTGDFQPGTRYAVKVAPPPAGANPQSYPRPGVLSTLVPDRQRGVWFEHTEGYLGTLGNRTVLAHAMNVRKLKLRVWRVYDNNLVAWQNASLKPWQSLDPFSRPLATRTITLGPEKNQVHDVRINLDEVLGDLQHSKGTPRALADGVYRVTLEFQRDEAIGEAADHDDGGYTHSDAAAVITLSDIGLTAKQGRDSLMAWAMSLSRGQPLAQVRVRVYSNKGQLLGEGLTNDDGLSRIDDLRPAEGEEVALVLADMAASGMHPGARQQPSTAPSVQSSTSLDEIGPAGSANLTWLNLQSSRWSRSDQDVAGRPYLRSGYEAFVFTERGVYRPGEMLHLRAIVRDATLHAPKPFPVQWQLQRPDLQDWRDQVLLLDSDGASAFDVQLPPDLPTGRWTAKLRIPGDSGAHAVLGSVAFHVEEFMPQRLKLTLGLGSQAINPVPADHSNVSAIKNASATARWTARTDPLHASLRADWLFGRPAAGLNARLNGRLDPVNFASPKWAGWTFGDAARVQPQSGNQSLGRVLFSQDQQESSTAMLLDQNGEAKWALNIAELLGLAGPGRASVNPADTAPSNEESAETKSEQSSNPSHAGPWKLSVAAEVLEPGGRSTTASNEVLVDTAPWYLGLRMATDGALRPRVPGSVKLTLVSPTGVVAPVDSTLKVVIRREVWTNTLVHHDGRYRYESQRILEPVNDKPAEVLHVRGGKGELQIQVPESGAYVLQASDTSGVLLASMPFYASDGLPWEDSVGREHPERLELAILPTVQPQSSAATQPTTRPSNESAAEAPVQIAGSDVPQRLRVGQQARVLVRSPFAGQLLLTVETDQVVFSKVVKMDASAVEVPIEITSAMQPNAYVTASVVRPIRPDAKWRAHRACGTARLGVEPEDRRLSLQVDAPAEVRPNSPLEVTLVARNARGEPAAGTAMIVMAVDEGILQWTRFATPQPLNFFWGTRALAVASGDLYGQLMPEVPSLQKISATGGDDSGEGRHLSVVVAKRVKSVALVAQVIHTNAQGQAVARFDVPQYAGRLRIMAVAYGSSAVGAADRNVLVRSPLLVESSFPRFVAPGDRFTTALTVFNNAQQGGSVRLSVDLGPGKDGERLLQRPQDLKQNAEQDPEQKRLVLEPFDLAAGGQHRLELPLEAAQAAGVATIRIRAEMGEEHAEETIELPVRPAAPRVTLGGYASARPGAPAKLDIPGGFMPGTSRLEIAVTPWPSLRVPEALSYLDQYPHGCAEQTISTCMPLVYLDRIGLQIAPGLFDPQRVSEKLQVGILRLMGMQTADGGLGMWPGANQSWPWASVYGAHLLVAAERGGHAVPRAFRDRLLNYTKKLLNRSGEPDLLEAQAYACYVLALAGHPERGTMSRLGEETFQKTAGESAGSAERTQARLHLALAWVAAGRADLARGMLPDSLPTRAGRQSGGNIGSAVRDRAMLLSARLAIDPQDPALPAVAQQLAGAAGQWTSTQDCAFAALALGEYLARTPQPSAPYTSVNLHRGTESLRSQGDGQALHWSDSSALAGNHAVAISGAPGAQAQVSWLQSGVPMAPPADHDAGIQIRRRYLNAKGELLDPAGVDSGEQITVELTLKAPALQQHIVIEDLLPAGLEVENPRLNDAQEQNTVAPDPAGGGPVLLNPTRLDVRDDRLVLVATMPASGTATYRYLVRAVTPGTYIVPPVRAECMYDIAMNSLSSGGSWLVVRSQRHASAGAP